MLHHTYTEIPKGSCLEGINWSVNLKKIFYMNPGAALKNKTKKPLGVQIMEFKINIIFNTTFSFQFQKHIQTFKIKARNKFQIFDQTRCDSRTAKIMSKGRTQLHRKLSHMKLDHWSISTEFFTANLLT